MEHRPGCFQGFGCRCDPDPAPAASSPPARALPRWLAIAIQLLRGVQWG
jgi:hypothetical protein